MATPLRIALRQFCSVKLLTHTRIRPSSCTRSFSNHQYLHSNQKDAKVNEPKQTHFGFEQVSEDEKESRVYEVFHNVASTYDTMNDAMSFGIHHIWKDQFVERLAPVPRMRLLDVAGGTGDIAFRFLNYVRNHTEVEHNTRLATDNAYHGAEVTVCDINQAMLDVGKNRASSDYGINSGISWWRGNAESLPVADNSFDAYTIAFGIRNCTHVDRVLEEAYRVLIPGGRFMCLEFSQVTNPLIRKIYDEYSFQVIPVMGKVIADDWKSYQYLVESIRQFPAQNEFADMIRNAGFCAVSYENLTMGVAAIHSGFKL